MPVINNSETGGWTWPSDWVLVDQEYFFPRGYTLHLVNQDFSSVKQHAAIFFKLLKWKFISNVSDQLPYESHRADGFSFLLWFWEQSSSHIQILMLCLGVKIAFSNTPKLPGWRRAAQGKRLIKQLLISSRHTLPVSPRCYLTSSSTVISLPSLSPRHCLADASIAAELHIRLLVRQQAKLSDS